MSGYVETGSNELTWSRTVRNAVRTKGLGPVTEASKTMQGSLVERFMLT